MKNISWTNWSEKMINHSANQFRATIKSTDQPAILIKQNILSNQSIFPWYFQLNLRFKRHHANFQYIVLANARQQVDLKKEKRLW